MGTTAPLANNEQSEYSHTFFERFPSGNGAVFGLISINSPDPSLKPLINEIRQRMFELAGREPANSTLLEGRFEQTVQILNEALDDFVEKSNDPGTLKDFNIALGTAQEKTLLLTGIGQLRATFIREEVSGTYHVYELFPRLHNEDASVTKISFGALISGEIQTDDVLGITTHETIDILSDNIWKQALSSMNAREVANFIRNSLATNDASGASLILEFGKNAVIEENLETRGARSISRLQETTSSTQNLLQGAVAPAVLKALRKTGRIGSEMAKNAGLKMAQSLRSLIKSSSYAIHSRGRNLQIGKPNLKNLFNSLKPSNLLAHRNQTKPHRSVLQDLKNAPGTAGEILISKFNTLPRKSKLLSVAIVVLIIVFIQSIIFLGYRRDIQAEKVAFDSYITNIEQLRNEAEASLIYNDEEKARSLLIEAQDKITKLPENSRSNRATKTRLLSELSGVIEGLQHEIAVTPTEIATLPTEIPAAFDNWLYVTDNMKAFSAYDNRVVGLEEGDKIFELKSGSLNELEATFPSTPVIDIKLFGTRMYTLAGETPQVYRLNKNGDGFGSGSAWITDGSHIAGARGLAIDGAVYVLFANEVQKYFTGTREDWQPYIDPPLENATKIWTHDETQGIYILEPAKRRVIVLDKPGKLVAQYVFPEESDLKDFAVDETGKKLSVRDGDKIKQIDLTHLK